VQAESLLRTLFDMRMERQKSPGSRAGLTSLFSAAEEGASSDHTLHAGAFHPLKVTGTQAMLARQAGMEESLPSPRRISRSGSEGLGAKGGRENFQFVKDLKLQFEEEQVKKYA